MLHKNNFFGSEMLKNSKNVMYTAWNMTVLHKQHYQNLRATNPSQGVIQLHEVLFTPQEVIKLISYIGSDDRRTFPRTIC